MSNVNGKFNIFNDLAKKNDSELSNFNKSTKTANKNKKSGSRASNKSKGYTPNDKNDDKKSKIKSPFMQLKKKKHTKYENIRVQYGVFKNLKRAQFANGIRSRSDLLEMMYDYCKPALFSSELTKKRAKEADKIMENQEQLKK